MGEVEGEVCVLGASGHAEALWSEWETHRPAVFGVAYRLLGSVADAEDVSRRVLQYGCGQPEPICGASRICGPGWSRWPRAAPTTS